MSPLSPHRHNLTLRALSLEWEAAKNGNPSSSVAALKPPLFAFHQAKNALGKWTPEKREISLSIHLVEAHTWDSVRAVLFHEMAHQMAHEIFHGQNHSPHGPLFQKACALLGANPKASGSYLPLKERILKGQSEDGLSCRIQKLLALGESENPHESQAALAKAKKLMEKHQIQSILPDSPSKELTTIFLGEPALRHHREFYALANLLCEHFFVSCIWAMACVVEKSKMGRVLEVSGTPAQVLSAEHAWHFVLGAIEREWKTVCKTLGKNPGRYRKSDFAVGLVQGFSDKLKKEKIKDPKALSLLPEKVRTPGLEAYLKTRYPRVVTRSRKTRRVSPKLLEEGRKKGEKLTLFRGIPKKNQTKGLLE